MNKRPDFSELRKEIAKLLEDQHGQVHDNDDADDLHRGQDGLIILCR